jgi:osmotically-inducible protein OsmY
MSDLQLRQNILDELEWEPSIDAADIGLAVENGVVTLTGHVGSYAEKLTAEGIVKRFRGVKAIAQEIEVRLTYGDADDEIAKRALNMLSWDVSVPKDAIQVKVEKGWLTLSGEVAWNFQRSAAMDDVRKLSGVMGCTNLIHIKSRVQVPDLQKRIEDALKRCAELEAKTIRVSVKDGEVTLEGRVCAWSERDALESAVWGAPGVKAVKDRVTIGS